MRVHPLSDFRERGNRRARGPDRDRDRNRTPPDEDRRRYNGDRERDRNRRPLDDGRRRHGEGALERSRRSGIPVSAIE